MAIIIIPVASRKPPRAWDSITCAGDLESRGLVVIFAGASWKSGRREIEPPPKRIQGFRESEGHLGHPRSTTRGPERRKTTTWKKVEREEPRRRKTTAPKMSPRWFLGSREATKRPPRAPQRSPGGPQESPKSAEMKPKRAPRRSHDHLRIDNSDFKKTELSLRRELDFRGSGGHLRDPKSTRRGPTR